ncbi:peptidase M23B [Actinoplanes sp. SE50]|uniref:DUF1259 domain-containing protein n=1 Tax=unclassified Actinoplanes TaxID=2626549 RepID=UPI00023EC0F0|nr:MULTISPECIES: DUF1259 domain-containing protein [unclassified Actinoplanes]AEV85167.1 lipoprotein LpqO [Actinoplanes sp. SE50/110]ATO83560.1 peptidase M23B [Actinoplanes sp. SE50]SLM00967.1 peptidase M23 [Actinoplanes sp. SE50/110]
MDTTRRRLLQAGWTVPAAALTVAAAAQPARAAGDDHAGDCHGRLAPVVTAAADWAPVAQALGREGKLLDDGRVYRVGFARRDLTVVSGAVTIKPALSLGSYAAFTRYRDGQVLLMGDLVVTEQEMPAVTDALQAAGLAQTGIHKHLLAHEPQLWWTHIHAVGDPVSAARGVRAALDHTGTPPPAPANTTPGELDTAALDQALGRTGAWDGGVYKYTIARAETITDHGRTLTPGMGVTTGLGFQPAGDGQAAVNGDIAMRADEVQPVITALRGGGVAVVELHNHALHDEPRMFYLHFWGHADAQALARTLRAAVNATATTP